MPTTLSALPGLDGFVRPRFDDGSFDDPLPLGEYFIERFLDPGADPIQLVIQGPRGSGLTTTLRWLAHLTREEGSRRVLTCDDLLGEGAEEALVLLARGAGILFLDMSITPLAPEAWRTIESAMKGGLPDRLTTRQTDIEILWSARLVLVSPLFKEGEPFGKATRWAASLSSVERVSLAPWSEDDLLELFGSSDRYRGERARLFGSLRGIRQASRVLERPRTARWLSDAALLEAGEVTLSCLYANVLDRLSPWAIELVREMDEDVLEPKLVGRLIDAPPEDAEEAASLFELSRVLAALLHELPGYSDRQRERVQGRAKGSSLILECPALALPGLHAFLQAGACLQALGRGQPPALPREAWFPFLRELITPGARARLRDLLRAGAAATDAAAATLLWATGEVPDLDASRRCLGLQGAWLAGISLPGANLSMSILSEANLTRARLEGADLNHSLLSSVRAPGAVFDGAELEAALFTQGARLQRASFRGAHVARASFDSADLTGACFEGAQAPAVNLCGARLDRSDWTRADLSGAQLTATSLADARFSGADLREARFATVDLRSAWLDGACLEGAVFGESRLCGLELDNAVAGKVWFTRCELSEVTFRAADLREASFMECRMHDAVFDGADLRGAEFHKVDFHAGSSRSGLLIGKPAQEGSMSGYYSEGTTDEKWASPESLRQASFRGADLRGASFRHSDLCRIDLRGACMDPALLEQARKAGALLDT